VEEYKGWEILKMIGEGELKEGTKLIGDTGLDYVVKKQLEGTSLVLGYVSNEDYPRSPALQGRTFSLVQEPVPFMDAAQAFNEGKNIRCEVGGNSFVYKAQENSLDELGFALIDYVHGYPVSTKEILNGKWFVL
jgi:hypothetical protein